MKALQRLNNPALAQYYAAAMQRLQREGMVSLDFPKQRRGAKVRFIQLVGTDTTGRQHILVTIDARIHPFRNNLRDIPCCPKYKEYG